MTKIDITSVNWTIDHTANFKPRDRITSVSEDNDPSQRQKNSLELQRHNIDSSDTLRRPQVKQSNEDSASL